MLPRLPLLLLFVWCAGVVLPASAAPARPKQADLLARVRVPLPAQWKLRKETVEGHLQWRAIPPHADQRERAVIDVTIAARRAGRKETPDAVWRRYRQPSGEREAAHLLRKTPNRLVVEYREGGFVGGQLWIVRRQLRVFQWNGDGTLLDARCGANASEFRTWRRNLETICLGAEYRP